MEISVNVFIDACSNGDLDSLEVLKEKGVLLPDFVRTANNQALRMTAANGHVLVLIWLKTEVGLSTKDAQSSNNYALRKAALHGYVNVLQCLKKVYELTDDDARTNNNERAWGTAHTLWPQASNL